MLTAKDAWHVVVLLDFIHLLKTIAYVSFIIEKLNYDFDEMSCYMVE